MTPEFAYFLKVNIAFVLFYLLYRLLFSKDTFFLLRRFTLLGVFGLAMVYPLLNFQEWVMRQEPMAEAVEIYSAILPELVIAPEPTAAVDWKGAFLLIGQSVYWGVMLLLVARFFLQLGSILLMAHRSRQRVLRGISLYEMRKPAGPFSFFRMIFVYPDNHSEKELEEILTHECTHVRQWHSIDVMIAEWVTILCWVNPAVWLLKREVRYNLEYLADNKVIQSGYDSKNYQYHLLGLAHNYHRGDTLYNNFNVLHLKNRIIMMNKKRTNGLNRMKYMVFLPVIALILLFSNIEAIARLTNGLPENGIVQAIGEVIGTNNRPLAGASVVVKDNNTGTVSDSDGKFALNAEVNATLLIAYPGTQSKEITVRELLTGTNKVKLNYDESKRIPRTSSEQPLTEVEKMPEFPGGVDELYRFIAKRVKYPVNAQENGYHGRVIASFIIEKDGAITDINIVQGVDPSIDAEVVRIIAAMPKWTPGEHNGKAVPVKYTVPVSFRLQGMESPVDQLYSYEVTVTGGYRQPDYQPNQLSKGNGAK